MKASEIRKMTPEQLIGSVLHAEHEQVLLQLLKLSFQLFDGQATNFLDFLCLHHYSPPFSDTSLVMMRVLMGSLC